MERIEQMNLVEKILLMNEIKKNYDLYSKNWSHQKVEWLQGSITEEIKSLGDSLSYIF